ncbi:NADH-quinone oxidoreductase subunit J family protein [Tuwongella immobilis]|uniref:NADH-quinone oxidoreductase subunit J n=1 Tax=Tuwongella immobilis TaxID=692036 RepID=A0A6C2YQL6_9BACT|nr:NADH-quinone oxidoreductase subunit J [Tuwongella immobilis]VIP03182.1 nadh-ubiquinone plastoquinone oxidoreductase chain 6 : NADH-ubiquinone/plastoquinone oxidoreductase chain 6 OS=Planctomyces limnophilus (strain ATCC 43296 / DSM 3776 / IFAM 1008 / 290) GN=Plim_0267 PE=3 SV=1: Oxidored_q3 [Tuwongella immobilis]VTS03633.1 nadh-ubiquinone plastoquinone oxidoreductase chain 6 : NADH-ubiquinone/plastoquinone oxidoreductase chain 6 OS=Planctomyces limnophilus (strain ATCC 43296 / DSM 3776 / IFAM 
MSLEAILFAGLASLVAVSAMAVVLTRNIVRSAVWLLFTLIGISMLYFLLHAEFLGAAQLIVYVGGTMVLVIFGVMLTAQSPRKQLRVGRAEGIFAALLGIALFAILLQSTLSMSAPNPDVRNEMPTISELGLNFLGLQSGATPVEYGKRPQPTFLLVFELLSVHLLVVLLGAGYLARAKRRSPEPSSEE